MLPAYLTPQKRPHGPEKRLRGPIKVTSNPAAALKREIHPNSRKALEENRARTQFNGPNAPPRCAKCNRFAWKKSPGGFCWFHAGNVKDRHKPRPTEYGQAKRSLTQARTLAKQNLDDDPPSPEELRYAATLVPKLISPYDRPRLEMLVRDVFRNRIDTRAFREALRALKS